MFLHCRIAMNSIRWFMQDLNNEINDNDDDNNKSIYPIFIRSFYCNAFILCLLDGNSWGCERPVMMNWIDDDHQFITSSVFQNDIVCVQGVIAEKQLLDSIAFIVVTTPNECHLVEEKNVIHSRLIYYWKWRQFDEMRKDMFQIMLRDKFMICVSQY